MLILLKIKKIWTNFRISNLKICFLFLSLVFSMNYVKNYVNAAKSKIQFLDNQVLGNDNQNDNQLSEMSINHNNEYDASTSIEKHNYEKGKFPKVKKYICSLFSSDSVLYKNEEKEQKSKEINNFLSSLENKNNELENKNNELENKNNELENKNNELEMKIQELNNQNSLLSKNIRANNKRRKADHRIIKKNNKIKKIKQKFSPSSIHKTVVKFENFIEEINVLVNQSINIRLKELETKEVNSEEYKKLLEYKSFLLLQQSYFKMKTKMLLDSNLMEEFKKDIQNIIFDSIEHNNKNSHIKKPFIDFILKLDFSSFLKEFNKMVEMNRIKDILEKRYDEKSEYLVNFDTFWQQQRTYLENMIFACEN
ncbi:hypothetical protein ['Cynodon dactylon' phytoplasma]|uniref:hypothetical protein n=1 Tax='Cynodon dactylon' phytoplasma TaxID=295320 RepID=UPI001265D449|nr:hypothetical protein ['Cynodon dactylon' phytoplasma]KAB8122110.1 hypothetical protein F1741_01065 ['Cynodon dactylon' phytoplasma]